MNNKKRNLHIQPILILIIIISTIIISSSGCNIASKVASKLTKDLNQNKRLAQAGEYLKKEKYEVIHNKKLKLICATKNDDIILIEDYEPKNNTMSVEISIDDKYKEYISEDKKIIKKYFNKKHFFKKGKDYYIAGGQGFKAKNKKIKTKILFTAKYNNFICKAIYIVDNNKVKEKTKHIEKEYKKLKNHLKGKLKQ